MLNLGSKMTHFHILRITSFLKTIKPPNLPTFFNWDALHARLNSHYEARSYNKKNSRKEKKML